MAKAIDHAKRKHAIVVESLKLFAAIGYNHVNIGMVAKNCGLSRTLLYTYFKDKREIFNEAIREITGHIAKKYIEVLGMKTLSADEKLRAMTSTVFTVMFANRDYLCTIADVLSDYRRNGVVPVERVKAHTDGLRRIFTRLLEEAVERGEYRKTIDIPNVTSILYSQYEAAALRITITGNAVLGECVKGIFALLDVLRI
ncbi:MAG: TetR/AcrR family transcriptional regulator [Kiritimatiellae bacterium]|nr:TetR/AcrR family transcriptional regulator [Kiritimatiellia bacterium]